MNYFEGKKILVPFDFSHLSGDAVETAIKIADRMEDITVLHVVDPTPIYDYGSDLGSDLGTNLESPDLSDIAEIDEDHEERALRMLQGHFGDRAHVGLKFDTAVDDPPHGITDYAAHYKFDLIVLPSHGRTGLKRLLIGSTAERVVRLAHCPVLVLRT